MTHPRRRFAAVSILATIALLPACTPESQTWRARTVDGLEIPQISWPHGPPDTRNPWVEGLLDALIARAAATNNHDLSSDGLRLYLTENYLNSVSRGPEQDALVGTYEYYAGPRPFRIGDITLETADRALVTACVLEWPYWGISQDATSDHTDFDAVTQGRVSNFWLERGDDGRIRLSVDAHGGSPCPLGNARAGYFDPPPDPAAIPSAITMPDGTVVSCDPEASKDGCPSADEQQP